MKIVKKCLIGLVIVLAGLFLFRNALLKAGIVQGVKFLPGFTAKVDAISLDLFRTDFVIEGLTIFNPATFQEKIFCDLPRLEVQCNVFETLRTKKLTFEVIEFNMQQCIIAKNTQGVTNVGLLASTGRPAATKEAASKQQAPVSKKPAAQKAGKGPDLLIKKFILSLHKVGYIDEGASVAGNRVFDLRLEQEVFENVRNIPAVGSIIMWEILKNTTLGRIPLGIDTGALQENMMSIAGAGKQLLTGGVDVSQQMINKAVDSAPDKIKELGVVTSVLGKETTQEVLNVGKKALGRLLSAREE